VIGEDDAGIRRSLVSAFLGAGYEVTEAATGPEVLQKAIVEQPDVIVMKVVFAGMNGDLVAHRLAEVPGTKAIPIVLFDDSSA
jgi:CheY-like chemotaxis protein